jgi:hypothetical protein
MDFGFTRTSANDYTQPSKATDRVVLSYDGYSSYLIIVDAATRFIWVFITISKELPLDIVEAFMCCFALSDGGFICTDQGGKLAQSSTLRDMLLHEFGYDLEPMGADSSSKNGAVKVYNGHLAIKVQMLLYMSNLPPKFWLAVLLHTVYLHNRLVHSVTHKTPFKGHFGIKPDLSYLKPFGTQVCMKQTGKCRSKLDHHDLTGIFLGYSRTDQNI